MENTTGQKNSKASTDKPIASNTMHGYKNFGIYPYLQFYEVVDSDKVEEGEED